MNKLSKIVPAVALLVIIATTALPFIALAQGNPYLESPITCKDAGCLFTGIIRVFLGGVALVATAMFVWGGFLFLTSSGNAEQIKKGKDTLLWSGLGIVIVLSSWVLISYLLKNLVNTTGAGT